MGHTAYRPKGAWSEKNIFEPFLLSLRIYITIL